MQVMQAVYQILWDGEVTDDCEMQSRNVEAAVDSATYLIGVVVSYFLFKTMNMIYRFSVQGNLPKEVQRKRMARCIIIVVIQCFVFLGIYICFNEMISNGKEFMHISRLTQLFAIYRIIGYLLNVALLFMMKR